MVTISESVEYEQASNLSIINDGLAYLYKEVMGKVFVKYGDNTFGPYAQATMLQAYGDGIAYFASEEKTWAVYVDGKKVSYDYPDCAAPIIQVDGHPTFSIKDNEGWKIISNKKVIAGPYPAINRLISHDNGVLCAIRKPDQKMCLLSIKNNEKTEGPNYNKIGSPVIFKNKVVYPIQKSDEVQMIVYDGQELTPYLEIGRVEVIKNKLVYTAKKAESEWVIVVDQKEYGNYPMIGLFTYNDDDIAYVANDPKTLGWDVYQKGELLYDFAMRCAGIGWLTHIKNELSYIYLNKKQWCSIRIGKEDLEKEYLGAKMIVDFDGKPAFAASLGREVPRWKVSIDEVEVTGEYADILALEAHKETLYALAVKNNRRSVVITITK